MAQSIQILRSEIEGYRPDPTELLPGQLSMNFGHQEPGLYFSNNQGELVKVGPCHIGTLPPNAGATPPGWVDLSVGEFWYDANTGLLKVWDGTAWLYQSNPGPSSSLQFAGLGLGVAPATGWSLRTNGGSLVNRVVTTPTAGVYTLNVQAGNEFKTSAAINGATTINLDNLDEIPAGYLWKGYLTFSYTSGAISWFTGNTGYSVVWTKGTPLSPTASTTQKVMIEVVGGSSDIEVTALG